MSDGSSESGSSTWSDVKRVLAIRLDSMGDVLMTSPALRAIREAPGVELLALLTSPAGAAAAALIAEVDNVMIYAAPWMKASGTPALAQDEAIIAQLRSERFDAAVIFTVFSQTPFPAAMLCRLAGIPRVLMHARERAYALASDEVRETEPENGIRHEVRRHLDLVSRRGWAPAHDQLSVTVPETAHRRIAEFKLPKGRWAVVHPGASAPSRRWPPDHFVEALRQLAALGWSFVLTGDAQERALCEAIVAAAAIEGRVFTGVLDLGELAALIAAAPLLITNNTGPAHLAAAVGTPVVVLYALTNPQHTPWAVATRVLSHDVECRWCFASVCRTDHHPCLRGVTPDAVVAAALELTASNRAVAA